MIEKNCCTVSRLNVCIWQYREGVNSLLSSLPVRHTEKLAEAVMLLTVFGSCLVY